MAWSTSELARLAGTTLKTVRHYHRIGLLAEPDRGLNGYKRYGVPHLVRLLRIRRLVDLGVGLADIAAMDDDDPRGRDALRALDADLAERIERLATMREEVAAILAHDAPVDLPAGFSEVGGRLGDTDRSLMLVYSAIYDEQGMEALREMLGELGSTPLDDELEALPDDADEATRQELAERFAPVLASIRERWEWVRDAGVHAKRGRAFAEATMAQAMAELYSVAQLDVLARAHALAEAAAAEGAGPVAAGGDPAER